MGTVLSPEPRKRRHKVSQMRTRLSCSFLSVAVAALCLGFAGCGGSTGSGTAAGGSSGSAGSGATGGSGSGCDVNGKHYAIGDTYPAGDNCNSCTCTASGPECTLADCAAFCIYGGQQYDVGQSFPASDGCNTCTCNADLQVTCTLTDCAPAPCTYAGKDYSLGQQFPALDGCNTCSCTTSGVTCTELACACNPQTEWWRNYVSTDPQQCMVIDYGCPVNTTTFENSCGCGCEQDASCPQSFDCMPPATCNEQEIKTKCPYSTIAY
jgi:hypothetical protein